MHKAFTRHCLSDAIKTLGVEVKTYARTARDNAYIVARGFAPRTVADQQHVLARCRKGAGSQALPMHPNAVGHDCRGNEHVGC